MIKKLINIIKEKIFLDLFRFPIQFIESLKINGLMHTLHEIIYFNRELVIVEEDLSSIQLAENFLKNSEIKGIEINKDNFEELHLKYPLKSRYLKALKNIKRGYKSFAIVKDKKVIGDIWFSNNICSQKISVHPDLGWLSIYLKEKDVYLFDLYVNIEERKNLGAISLFKLTLQRLKQKGYSKAYAFIFVDNEPSIILARFLKFRELKILRAFRFCFIKKLVETKFKT